jgi:hypothetical protein
VAVLAVLAVVSADFDGQAPYVQPPSDGFSPRMRELLESCEGAGDDTRRLLKELKKEMHAEVQNAITTIVTHYNLTALSAATSQAVKNELAGAEGLLGYLQAAVARMNSFFPQACSPQPVGYADPNSPWALVLQVSAVMRSDMGGVFFLIQAWGFNGGCKRWILMVPAFLLSPPIIMAWLVAVWVFRIIRAWLSLHTWFTHTKLGAWLCCAAASEQPKEVDLERQRRKREAASEMSWLRRFYTAACNMVAGDPADLPPPPPEDRSADPSSSSRPQEEGERETRSFRSAVSSSIANLSNIFTA